MPSLNEAETIGTCIDKARAFLREHAIDGEVLIADNGSTDGSQDIARAKGARVIAVETRGYGAALIAGIRAAGGRFVIMGDSDDSYDFSDLMPFVEDLRRGAELVMGNRFRGGIAENAMPPLHRYLGNPVLSLVGRVFYRTPVRDFHCGLRGFSREAILGLNLTSTGMEFASEMVVKAALHGLTITEVPTTLSPDGRSRPPHLRSWRDGWRHLKLLLSYAPHWLFLYPGLILFSAGTVMFLLLMTGPVTISGVRFDIAALILAIACVLTGAQMVIFFTLARLHAVLHRDFPTSRRFEALRRHVSVNRASLIGGALMVSGTLSAAFSVLYWVSRGLGDLDPSVIARPATLAVVAVSLGIQLVTGGFLWGLIESSLEGE
jgi:hypothetical protein